MHLTLWTSVHRSVATATDDASLYKLDGPVHSAVGEGMSYAQFKRYAAQAVRKHDLVVVKRRRRSTVSRYLRGILAGQSCRVP